MDEAFATRATLPANTVRWINFAHRESCWNQQKQRLQLFRKFSPPAFGEALDSSAVFLRGPAGQIEFRRSLKFHLRGGRFAVAQALFGFGVKKLSLRRGPSGLCNAAHDNGPLLPPATASAARERVLKNRAAQSHLSMRICSPGSSVSFSYTMDP